MLSFIIQQKQLNNNNNNNKKIVFLCNSQEKEQNFKSHTNSAEQMHEYPETQKSRKWCLFEFFFGCESED